LPPPIAKPLTRAITAWERRDQALQFVDGEANDAAAVILSFMRGLVATGAERLVAGASQHDAGNVAVVGGNLKRLDQFFQRLTAKGIIELGPVDDDPGGPIADFVDHIGEFGRILSSVKPRAC
jgi:methylmalonyl-CoA mutase cobalamin-binding subunit